MANNNFNAPAFPDKKNSGLTKREYFAAMAMQGYLASYGPAEPVNSQHVAEKAVRCADALLTELEKSNQ